MNTASLIHKYLHISEEEIERTVMSSNNYDEYNAESEFDRICTARSAVETLNIAEKAIFLNYIENGCSIKKTAARIGLSAATVKRALKIIRIKIDENIHNNISD